jgi:hypothetical protein
LAGARAAFEADLTISERLAVSDAANAGWQADLAITLNKLGGLAMQTGDNQAARKHWTNALEIYLRLTKLDPTNADWRESQDALRRRLEQLPAK